MKRLIYIALAVLTLGCYRSDQDIVLNYNAFDPEYAGEDIFELVSTFSFTQILAIDGIDVEVPSASHKFRVKNELLQIETVPYQIRLTPTSLPSVDSSPSEALILNRFNANQDDIFEVEYLFVNPGDEICAEYQLGNHESWGKAYLLCTTVE